MLLVIALYSFFFVVLPHVLNGSDGWEYIGTPDKLNVYVRNCVINQLCSDVDDLHNISTVFYIGNHYVYKAVPSGGCDRLLSPMDSPVFKPGLDIYRHKKTRELVSEIKSYKTK